MSKYKWNSNDVPDQNGRVAVVTGASSGIGYETARVLAEKNAKVIIAVRNLDKGKKAAEKIKTRHEKADLVIMELDLADLKSVKQFAEAFKKEYEQLDLLINNAGVMIPPYSKTTDGFELQFGTNHLGHFALTGLLLDLLKKTAGSRIVNVSSMAHTQGNINFDDLNWEKRTYAPWNAYGDSKIANLYFTYELNRKMDSADKTPLVVAAHPGVTATDLQRHSGLVSFLSNLFAQKIEMGALPTLYAAVAPDVKSGDYFGPSGFKEIRGYPKKVESNALSHDTTIANKLWDISEKLTGITYNF
jgi:NAD(P)-dependent dehydrogenase (short-subunit alcohol dehydrogenase family)